MTTDISEAKAQWLAAVEAEGAALASLVNAVRHGRPLAEVSRRRAAFQAARQATHEAYGAYHALWPAGMNRGAPAGAGG